MYSQIFAFEVRPEHCEAFRQLGLQHQAACLRDEPGTLRFDSFRDEANPDRFYVFETYVDQAAFEAHRNGPILQRNWPLFEPMLAAPPTLIGRGFDLEPD
jgi:autoinducer 2-degrading protein